jgi:transposase-like protein
LSGDQTLAELAACHKVHPNLITKWKRQAGEREQAIVEFEKSLALNPNAANVMMDLAEALV